MADIATLILEIIKCIATPTCRCIDHHRKFKQDVEDLKTKLRDLNSRKRDVEMQLGAEVCSQKEVEQQVEDWLQDVQRINVEIQQVEQRVDNALYLSRARLGKLVREKINAVDAILQRGSFPEGLVVDKPATALPIPVENLEGEASVKEKIWEYLTGNEVQIIGVCGIGGVGKTTIMKHIHNELLFMQSGFDTVIWVTVSYPLNVVRLQHEIAKGMNGSLPENEDEQKRASRLMQMMGRVKYALILDDVWQRFTLQDVGIPRPTVENGCKIVITSRKVDVCKSLGCQIVKVSPLSKQESLNLFLDKVGRDILQIPELEAILKLMVDECAGLPLAIVVIAGSMKGVTNVHEWRHACEHLRDIAKGSGDEIFERLKFSYDRLQHSNIQNCFLYYSLYPEGYIIRRDELVEKWIDEGLIEELGSRQAKLDKGQTILNKLENSCLLEKAYSEDTIKMLDVVRDMALRIKSIGPQFMVKARVRLTEIPDEHEWVENLEKVSLMENEISNIPLNMCPNCPNLTTLMLQRNSKLSQIPNCFFANMQGLKVLNLSETGIESLPNSICNLVNLTTLLLCFCEKLKYLPCLDKLKALKKLDLKGAGIEEVPQGMQMLISLEYLDLSCDNLKELPTGVLSNLSHLQFLYVYVKAPTASIGRFLHVQDFNIFLDRHDFYYFAQSKVFQGLTAYRFFARGYNEDRITKDFCQRVLLISDCEIGGESIEPPNNLLDLRIYRCTNLRSSLSKTVLLEKAIELNWCTILDCEEMEFVLDFVSSGLDKLKNLKLCGLPNLCALVRVEGGPTPPGIFSNLRSLIIRRCPRIRKLFPLELLQAVQNLEEIRVRDCEQMEEIIASDVSVKSTLPLIKKKKKG